MLIVLKRVLQRSNWLKELKRKRQVPAALPSFTYGSFSLPDTEYSSVGDTQVVLSLSPKDLEGSGEIDSEQTNKRHEMLQHCYQTYPDPVTQ